MAKKKTTTQERLTESVETKCRRQEQKMEALKATYRKEDVWQIFRDGDWRDLPKGYEPGWFFDEQYRRKPDQGGNVFSSPFKTLEELPRA